MNDDDALECGRSIDELSSYVQAGRTPHDRHIESCPDCLNVIEALERVGQLSRDLVADDAEHLPRPPRAGSRESSPSSTPSSAPAAASRSTTLTPESRSR